MIWPLSKSVSFLILQNVPASFVNLYLPYDFLKDELIIDGTPGVGSMHQHNTDEAYSFMKDSDAIIFMLSVDSPINEIEREFFCSAKNHAAKFYFAVNKIDMVTSVDLEAYLGYCHDILCEIMGVDTLHLAPISAKKNVGIDALFSGILQDIQTVRLNRAAEGNRDKKTREFERALREILETDLYGQLSQLSQLRI